MIYLIKQHTGYLASRGNRGKKTILAFKNKQHAIDMMSFYCDIEKQGGMLIQKTSATSVISLIKNTGLDFSIIDDNCSYCLEPDNNYLESLCRSYNSNHN